MDKDETKITKRSLKQLFTFYRVYTCQQTGLHAYQLLPRYTVPSQDIVRMSVSNQTMSNQSMSNQTMSVIGGQISISGAYS